jgi:hypothetical protein
LNGGAVAGVACFSTDHVKGLTPLDRVLRSVAPSLNQTTPPVGPASTASDILFNPSSTVLFATIKGSPGPPVAPGFIFAWPVQDGIVSSQAVAIQKPDLILDFSASFLGSDSKLIMTDPAYGAAIISISPTLEVSTLHHIPIAGEAAVCWSVFAPRFHSVYIMDVGVPKITVIDPESGAILGQAQMDPTALGGFDAAADRTFLYVLAGDQSIVVMSLLGGNSGKLPTQIQKVDLSTLGPRQGWQGMAVYPSS